MGYKLRREVRDALPPGVLTAAERLLVLELADICGDDTREGWPGAAKLAGLTDLSERSIQETMARIGRKWIELRVKLTEKDGRPIYAYAGKRTTYRFPALPPSKGAMDLGSLGATDPEERCDGSVPEVRQIRGPSPQGTSLKINTSSLSASEALDVQAVDRERGESCSQKPKTLPEQLLAKNNVPAEKWADIEKALVSTHGVRNQGWWVTVDQKGHLPLLVADALQDLTASSRGGKPPWCGHCDERTRQRTTEWMENVSISRCYQCHPLVVAAQTAEESS